MSIRVINRVWEHAPSAGTALLLLLALADHANDDGICWPSVDTLAHKARTSERSVQRLLRDLEKDGEVYIETGGGRAHPNRYAVLSGLSPADAEQLIERWFPPEKGDKRRRKGDKRGPKGVNLSPFLGDTQGLKGDTAMSPEPNDPLKESSIKDRSDDDDNTAGIIIPSDEAQLIAIWDETFDYSFPDADRAALRKALDEGLTPSEWVQACVRARSSFESRFPGDRIHRIGYVLKCRDSIRGERQRSEQSNGHIQQAASIPPTDHPVDSDLQALWTRVVAALDVSADKVETWIDPLRAIVVEDGLVVVAAPNVFVRDQVVEHLGEELSMVLAGELQRVIALEVVIA